jgi:hypothetical protein
MGHYTSAKSGAGKSETFRPISEPFFDCEKDLVEHWEAEELPGLLAEADLLETEVAKLRRDAVKGKPEKKGRLGVEREAIRDELKAMKKAQANINNGLNPPRLCCEDVTSQKLAVMLAQNHEQLASLSPDAGNIVNILLGQYSKLDRTDENIYLKAYTGDTCRVDRQGREPIVLQRPCLSALWLVQPDKVETLLAERSMTDGGLIPRLLMCHSHAQHQPIMRGTEGIPQNTTNEWASLVSKLIRTFHMAPEPVTLETVPEVLDLMDNHCNQIVERMNNADLQDVTTYAARWNEQAWRIAVCLHAGLHGEAAGVQVMAADTAASAIAIADWFAGEQLRILDRGREAARLTQSDEVLSVLADNPKGITARMVQLKRITGTAEEAHTLLAQMESDGELKHTESKPEGGGHVTLVYQKTWKFT